MRLQQSPENESCEYRLALLDEEESLVRVRGCEKARDPSANGGKARRG